MSEIASLNSRILRNVYHRAWDRDLLRSMQEELEEKKRQLDAMRRARPSERSETPQITGTVHAGDQRLTVHDTRLIANALYTQRPLIYASEEWSVYRRVCASLVRLFAHELEETGEFDQVEFLTHCGLSHAEAQEMSRRPGDHIRRSEESFRPRPEPPP
jgi:hypothetical protein